MNFLCNDDFFLKNALKGRASNNKTMAKRDSSNERRTTQMNTLSRRVGNLETKFNKSNRGTSKPSKKANAVEDATEKTEKAERRVITCYTCGKKDMVAILVQIKMMLQSLKKKVLVIIAVKKDIIAISALIQRKKGNTMPNWPVTNPGSLVGSLVFILI